MYPLTIGLVIETKELWDEVHATLQELPVRLLVEQHELGDLAEFLDKVERLRPEVMILEVMKLRSSPWSMSWAGSKPAPWTPW